MKRFNVEIPEERFEDMKKMMKTMGLRTQKELFDNAMTITNWMIRQRKKGDIVGSYNEEKEKLTELVMPCLEFIRPDRK